MSTRKDLLNLSENLKIAISQSNHTNFLLLCHTKVSNYVNDFVILSGFG